MLLVDTNDPIGIWVSGPHRRFLTTFITPILNKEVTGLSVGMVIVPPNTFGGLHQHEKAQEIWYILEGNGQIQIGEEIREVRAGYLAYSPPQVKHQIINNQSAGDLKALLILCPAGDEKAILDELARTGCPAAIMDMQLDLGTAR